MKITIINQEPIYIENHRGESIKRAMLGGAEYVEIDGNVYRTSSITAVTDEEAPKTTTMWNYIPEEKRLAAPEHKAASLNSASLKRFHEMRQKLGI